MPDNLEEILRLVADGYLTASEAAPILDALSAFDADGPAARPESPASPAASDPPTPNGPATSIRIEVTEDGRKVINLRVPVSLGRMALDRIPGISGTNADLVRRALSEGRSGTLLVIDDEGSGVRIGLE